MIKRSVRQRREDKVSLAVSVNVCIKIPRQDEYKKVFISYIFSSFLGVSIKSIDL